MRSSVCVVVALLLLAGCHNAPGVDDRPHLLLRNTMLTHVVICWLKDSGSVAEQKALLDAVETIRSLPEVSGAFAGHRLPTDNPLADNTWDVAFEMVFADEDALRKYEADPIHLRLKREVLAPNVRQVKVFDIKE